MDPHDIISLSNGNYLILAQEVVVMDLSKIVDGGNSKANVIGNVLIELDTKGKVHWIWRTFDHTQITDIAGDLPLTQYSIDFTHINSMDDDPNGNMGSVQRLENGNTLVNYSNGKIVEVKPDKTIAFEMNHTMDGNFFYIAQKTTNNSIFSKKNIDKDARHKFYDNPKNTGIRLELNDVSDSTPVYVELHRNSPPIG